MILSRHCLFSLLLFVASLFSLPSICLCAAEFELRHDDRVVLVGDGLIEQEQYFGWIELMLTCDHADRDVTFRNLGWNGDLPNGQSRFGLSLLQAGHEPADEGWKQLNKQIELTKPTVVIFGYGMAAALESSSLSSVADQTASLEDFGKDLKRLSQSIRDISPDCRFVFLSPISPVGPSSVSSQRIESYRRLIAQIATEEAGYFVDLTKAASDPALRKDAVHLNGDGYKSVALAIESSLSLGKKRLAIESEFGSASKRDFGEEPVLVSPLTTCQHGVCVRVSQTRTGPKRS